MELTLYFTVFYWTILLISSTCNAFTVPETLMLEDSPMEPVVNFNRIIGGEEAQIEDYPYQVSMIMNNTYFCGGFIVSQLHIITAAHCVQNFDASDVLLRAGSRWRTNGTIIPILEVTSHPEYNQRRFDKDIAVMRAVDAMNFTETIQPVQLPYRGQVLEANSRLNVSGWGKLNQSDNTIPIQLMAVETSVVRRVLCYVSYPFIFTRNMICAGDYSMGGEGTCQGDSGGAAVQNSVAVGITSFGRGCGQRGSPSVFTSLAAPAIYDFITNHTNI